MPSRALSSRPAAVERPCPDAAAMRPGPTGTTLLPGPHEPTFLRDETGAIALVFALLLVPMLGAVGLAVDYQRLSTARQFLQS